MVRLILLILICPIFTQSKAQTYYPFPDSNAVWNFSYSMVCLGFPGGNTYADYSITITGDTTINNLIYKKLYNPYLDMSISGSCTTPDSGYMGSIRQDTTARRVYIIPPNDSTEQLLYDFTLQLNDTVTGYLTNGIFMNDKIVLSIDSVLVGNNYRKRWLIDSCYEIYIIEGIGSTYGLVEEIPGCILDVWNYYLTCFKQDNQILYPDTATSCDIITVSVDEKENINYGFTIIPNPVSDELNISFTTGITSEAEIQILNILGKVERKFNINNIQKDNVEKLKTEYLPAGLYFIRVNIDGNTVCKKFFKL